MFDACYEDLSTSIPVWASFRLLGLPNFVPSRPQLSAHYRRESSRPAELELARRNILPRARSNPVLHLTKFKNVAIMVPTTLAAGHLIDFYEIIALKIETGQYSHWQPSRNIILELWDLELEISCNKIAVPWSFVQAWVIDMAALSARQFTGFYEATVRGDGDLTGLVFLIKMQVKDRRPLDQP